MDAVFDFEQGWILRDKSFSFDNECMKASAYALANGYMGNRGALEEMSAGLKEDAVGTFVKSRDKFLVGTYINGIYDAPDGDLGQGEVVNAPNWASVTLRVNGEPLDLETGTVLSFDRWFDLREPMIHRQLVWRSPAGKVVTIDTERFVSMSDIHAGLIRWRITAGEEPVAVTIESGIDANVTNMRTEWHFQGVACRVRQDTLYCEATTLEQQYHIGVASVTHVTAAERVRLRHKAVRNKLYVADQYSGRLPKGGSIELTKVSTLYTSRDVAVRALAGHCVREAKRVASLGYAKAWKRHARCWKTFWKETDMVLEGDKALQIGVRFSAYHLLNTGPRHSTDVSFPARSLSSQEHWGSVHWDNEIFIMPYFTYVVPKIARNMLIYRHKTLDGARRKAARLGYRGAFYAWESHETGDEVCPSFVMPDRTGRLQRNFFWDGQIHISADVAYAVWQYYEATGDWKFMLDYGAEILFEIARFNESRAHYDVANDQYILVGVIGADEYHENVDNNAFTNWMVWETLGLALKVVKRMKKEAPLKYEALAAKIGLQVEEIGWWRTVRDKLFVPQPDPKTGIIEEFTGYFQKEDCSFKKLYSRRADEHEYLGGVGGLVTQTQIVKQADVVMVLYLMRELFSEKVKRANWEFYEPRTEHGSSLSTMGYALVAADVGMMKEAGSLYKHTSLMDLDPKYYSGYYSHGVHPCALAGALLGVIIGFCGITLKEDGVHWRAPHMPAKWKKVQFFLRWHGVKIQFTYSCDSFKAQIVENRKKLKVPFHIGGRRVLLSTGKSVDVL